MKYLIFADVAEKEGKFNIARLFRIIVYAERVHATNYLKVLGGVKRIEDNLETAIRGEIFESEKVYPVYNSDAKLQNEKKAERSTHYALQAEKMHAGMYKRVREAVKADNDVELRKIYICPVCGYTAGDRTLDYCPVCGAKKDVFRIF